MSAKENYSLSYHEEKKMEIKIKEKYERITDTLWYKRKIIAIIVWNVWMINKNSDKILKK